jgi:hypothetical protein
MKIDKSQKPGLGIAISLILTAVIWGTVNKIKLNRSHQIEVAKLTDFMYGGKGNAGSLIIYYNLYVEGKVHHNSTPFSTAEISARGMQSSFMGKTFPVKNLAWRVS